MTIKVENPMAGALAIAGVHDGACAVQRDGTALTVAFRWSRMGRRPETAVGGDAVLDGAGFRVASIARSPLSAGFYVAVLTPATTNLPTAPAAN